MSELSIDIEGGPEAESKVGRARVNVLESELANKTKVLETTEKLLTESQRQYKELLATLRRFSSGQEGETDKQKLERLNFYIKSITTQLEEQTSVMAEMKQEIENLQIENEKLRRMLQYNGGREPRNMNDRRIQRSIFQLRQAQEDIMDLKTERENLYGQTSYLRRELKEWSEFAAKTYEEISESLKMHELLPKSDPILQRRKLSEIIQKLCRNFSVLPQGRIEPIDLQRKYNKAKNSLHRVQKQCDKILNKVDLQRHHGDYVRDEGSFSDDYMYMSPKSIKKSYRDRSSTNNDLNNTYTRKSFKSEPYRSEDDYESNNGNVYESTKVEKIRSNDPPSPCDFRGFDDMRRTNSEKIGKCVKDLHNVTKRMKDTYRDVFQG